MKKKAVYIAVILVVIGVLLVGRYNRVDREASSNEIVEDEYVPVEVESIRKDTISNKISLNGKVFANEEIMVTPKMPGTIVQSNVKSGDHVRQGDVLFVIDQKEILRGIEQAQNSIDLAQHSVDQAKNAINTAQINYKTVKENVDNALINLERTRLLYEAGAVSKSQLEQAEIAASTRPLEVAEGQVKQAEINYRQSLSQLNQVKISYEQSTSNLNNTLIIAPISGIITNVNVIEGQLASNAQSVATIVDMDKVYIQLDVPENTINRLFIGQEVSVKIPSATEEELKGKIDYINPTVDPRTQLYKVKVYVSNEEQKIKPGMSASIILDIDSRQDVLTVRSRAIIDNEEKALVYVVENDKAIQREIVLGLDTGLYIEVKEGLEEGDVVIIKGQHYVGEGQLVKVVRGE